MKKATLRKLEQMRSAILNIKPELEDEATLLEEQYSERSERWLESEAGEKAQEQLEYLKAALTDLESALDNLDSILGEEN